MSVFDPTGCLEEFNAIVETGAVPLVCDTNVYLDAREAIGVEEDGRLRIIYGPAALAPTVSLLRAPSVAGVQTHFVFAVAVQNELFSLIRDGYGQRPEGLRDAHKTATAVRNLMALHPLGQVAKGGWTYEASLPDPPLSANERNDRHIWCQAELAGAILVTSDTNLIAAVRQATGNVIRALSPLELIDLAGAYKEACGG